MSNVSVLHMCSYGQVSEDNPEQSRTIKVKVLESLPSQYGSPTTDIYKDTVDVNILPEPVWLDAESREKIIQPVKTVSIGLKNFVKANWLNRTGTLISPPRVVVGQRVVLWRVGDSTQYYWEELDVDIRLKPEEHVVIAINNHNDGEALDIDNAYIIEASTVNQRIRVRTNRNNGETSAFEVNIDGGKGRLSIMDDEVKSGSSYNGNGVFIDTSSTTVRAQNVGGSYAELVKNTINMRTTNFNIDTSDFNINTSKFTINSGITTLTGKTFTVNAKTTITMATTILAALSAGSGATISGALAVTGSIAATGIISGANAVWKSTCKAASHIN